MAAGRPRPAAEKSLVWLWTRASTTHEIDHFHAALRSLLHENSNVSWNPEKSLFFRQTRASDGTRKTFSDRLFSGNDRDACRIDIHISLNSHYAQISVVMYKLD